MARCGSPPPARPPVAAAAVELNRYPDRDAVALRQSLAQYLSRSTGVPLTSANVWAANGSNEVMSHLLTAFGGPGRSVLTFTPTYSMYPEYARNTFTGYVTEPRNPYFTLTADLVLDAVRRHEPTIVLITTPNNPTGTSVGLEVFEAVLEGTEAIVVADGTSCRHQIADGAAREAVHVARLLESLLDAR